MREEVRFKSCSCGESWASREAFVRDADIKPIGITFGVHEPRLFYFFNHGRCESTLAIDAEEFVDLFEEPIPPLSLKGLRECQQFCTTLENLKACDRECQNAPFRRFFLNRILTKDI